MVYRDEGLWGSVSVSINNIVMNMAKLLFENCAIFLYYFCHISILLMDTYIGS